MVLIPNDIGVRMRLQAESALLQPASPVREIASDLPELRPGQTFTAQIQESLPDNTYRALVAGRALTLSLPEGAKAGDSLDLVVIDRSSRVVMAELAKKDAAPVVGNPYPYADLSPAAKLIGSLLPDEGTRPPPASLTRGEPVVTVPPTNPAQLATALATAVEKSGLFYESHQADWVNGKIPLARLLQEPQSQHSDFNVLISRLVKVSGTPMPVAGTLIPDVVIDPVVLASPDTPPEESAAAGRRMLNEAPVPGAPVPASAQRQTDSATNETASPNSFLPAVSRDAIPEEIRPLVQQQLEALATSRLAWHGEVWPQQQMEWEVEREPRNSSDTAETADQWITSLKLSLPNLGQFSAKLYLTASGVTIAMRVNGDILAAELSNAVPTLAESLAAAGVPLLGSLVRQEDALPSASDDESA